MMQPRPAHVVILTDFARARGGASALAMLQARLLGQRGVKVTVFAGDESADMPPGVNLLSLGGKRLLDQGRAAAAVDGLWNAAARRALSGWIAQHDEPGTIYHVHGIQQTLSPSVLSPLRPHAARVVLHAHDYFLACPNGAFFDFRAGRACERRAMSAACLGRNCDKRSRAQKLWRLARQSLQDRQTGALLQQGRVVLIHPAMGQRLWPGRQDLRATAIPNPAAALVDGTDPVSRSEFVYVGDIHAYKGVFLLAEAARRAGVPLRFLGDGQDRARLQSAYPEHHYDGWVDRQGLARRLSGARALVAPTLGPEPYGLAPVEALLSGVPVILSDSMLLAQDIRRLGAGATFAAGDTDDLAERLSLLAGDDDALRAMAARSAAAGAQLSLPPEAWADRLMALYSDMLAQGQGNARQGGSHSPELAFAGPPLGP
ncbi:MAG: glycosyltransferase [Paracoccaceae bacterium]